MIKIGFWRKFKNEVSELPWPTDSYDPRWDDEERDIVASYLDQGKVETQYKGWSECRICGCDNGSADFTDGTYLWPQGFGHYVRKHNIRPPQEFIDHAIKIGVSEVTPNLEKPDLEAMAREIREADERVGTVTVPAEYMKPIPYFEPSYVQKPAIAAKAKELDKMNTPDDFQATLDKMDPKIAKAYSDNVARRLDKLKRDPGSMIPDWDRLSFDEKADQIRELTISRMRNSGRMK